MKENKKKVFMKVFGCQMNIRDSEFVMGILLEDGFRMANSLDKADIILFNSCSVRKHAEDRLFSNIANLDKLKKTRPVLVVGLIGCTAQNYKDKILERSPLIDFVCGPGNESDLPEIIKDVLKNRCPIIAADKIDAKRPELFPEYRESSFKAYVSISEGCNNFCSYCIVPYVRGRERSRDSKDIIKEARDLASRDFKEITLLGQNVNSYGITKSTEYRAQRTECAKTGDFIKLLERLNSIKGIERVRFMTSHPKDASTDLFRAMSRLDKVCEHLHLPLQSGSDRILKLMNRGYTAARYLKLIDDYRRIVKDGSVTTDILVGFPSETDEDFNRTKNLIKKIGFDGAFMFKYSPRPPAKSVGMPDDVRTDVKEKRLAEILNMQCEISRSRNEPMKGKTVEILVDGRHKKGSFDLTGRTRTNKTALFNGKDELIGKLVRVEIGSIKPHTLMGSIAE